MAGFLCFWAWSWESLVKSGVLVMPLNGAGIVRASPKSRSSPGSVNQSMAVDVDPRVGAGTDSSTSLERIFTSILQRPMEVAAGASPKVAKCFVLDGCPHRMHSSRGACDLDQLLQAFAIGYGLAGSWRSKHQAAAPGAGRICSAPLLMGAAVFLNVLGATNSWPVC